MPNEIEEVKNFLKETITFTFHSEDKEVEKKYGGAEFTFKIPSVASRIKIETVAGRLRQEADPEGNGNPYAQHPAALIYVENVATFQVLLDKTSAPWVYSVGDGGKPKLDWNLVPDDTPVSEIVAVFNRELDTFRANGNKSG